MGFLSGATTQDSVASGLICLHASGAMVDIPGYK